MKINYKNVAQMEGLGYQLAFPGIRLEEIQFGREK